MRSIIFSIMALAAIATANAEELNFKNEVNNESKATVVALAETAAPETTTEKNNWGAKLKESPLGLGLDIQTKYMWRGMEMMTEDAAPVLFPSFNYSYKGLFIYAMGGYAINGKYAEVDLGASYTWKGFTIGFNDYYYPTVDSNKDEYLGGHHNGHWLEAYITYAPEKVPIIATLSNFFAGGNDRYVNEKGEEKQAYSTYLEVGTYYDFLNNNRITLTCGMALNKSCYNGYEHNISVCNVEAKYTYNVQFKNGWTLPLSAAYIYNPVFDKSFVNLTANIAF